MEPMNCLFDTHCHLTDKNYKDNSMTELIFETRRLGVRKILTVGTNFIDSIAAMRIATIYEGVFFSFGLHPNCASNGEIFTKKNIEKIYENVNNRKFIAIGECGLDYYHPTSDEKKKMQKDAFIQQIEMAIKLKRPLIIHTRNAHSETIKILSKYSNINGVIHCFQGTKKEALKYVELGFYISFSGIITFDNAKDIKEVVKVLPLNKILIETDAPYLAPHPYRGQINFPWFVKLVANELAKILNISFEEILKITFNNAESLFGWF